MGLLSVHFLSPDHYLPEAAPPNSGETTSLPPLGNWAWEQSAGQGLLTRLLARYRPVICPFDRVVRQVPVGSRVLDLGCGRGLLLGWLHVNGRAVTGAGVDVDAGTIRVARALAERLDAADRLNFAAATLVDPWPAAGDGEVANVVTLIDVMHHLPREVREPLIGRIAAELPVGGRLVYKDMATRPWPHRVMNRLHDLMLARQWIREEPIGHIEGWADAAGLRVIHRDAVRRVWYSHEMRVFEKPADA